MTYVATLLSLAQKATPGPWHVEKRGTTRRFAAIYSGGLRKSVLRRFHLGGHDLPLADAAYIAAVSPDRVIALIQTITDLQEDLGALTTKHAACEARHNKYAWHLETCPGHALKRDTKLACADCNCGFTAASS